MLTDRGANCRLVTDTLDPALFVAGRHLHLSGYVLLDEATRSVGLTALELAAAAGMTRSVDPCSAGPLAAVGADAFLSWTGGIEWCCANLDEGRRVDRRQAPRRCPGRFTALLPGDGRHPRGRGSAVVRAGDRAPLLLRGPRRGCRYDRRRRRLHGDVPRSAPYVATSRSKH